MEVAPTLYQIEAQVRAVLDAPTPRHETHNAFAPRPRTGWQAGVIPSGARAAAALAGPLNGGEPARIAALAALMSTADSALLSISSMLTKDIYLPYFHPDATEAELTKFGKISSWGIVIVLVLVAIGTEATLVRLLELKFEVLIQVGPCFFLGLYWPRLTAGTALLGMLCGLAVALGLTLAGHPLVWGFHAGVLGLFVNAAVCAVGTLLKPAPTD